MLSNSLQYLKEWVEDMNDPTDAVGAYADGYHYGLGLVLEKIAELEQKQLELQKSQCEHNGTSFPLWDEKGLYIGNGCTFCGARELEQKHERD
jgi:hypothetical protein